MYGIKGYIYRIHWYHIHLRYSHYMEELLVNLIMHVFKKKEFSLVHPHPATSPIRDRINKGLK